MRVTIEMPEELLSEVMKITGAKTKRQAVKLAVEETIARAKRRKLIKMKSSISTTTHTGMITSHARFHLTYEN